MIEFRNILLPTDFSETALLATRYAVELTRRYAATLHLLHVIEDPHVFIPIFESWPAPSREEFEQFARDRLENWILPEDAAGLTIEPRWVHGSPVPEIVREIREHQIDLCIMGSHGRGVASHLLFGSVAERIVQKAPCPVLTVRPDEHQFVHP